MNPRLRAVVRSAVLVVNTPVARNRLTRELAAVARPFKLEIGGLTPRAGWLVTNVSAVTKNYLDATIPWPIEDAAISHVYADNVIEHVTLQGARALFAEAFRCLVPGGVLRVVTPDIHAHVQLYLEGRDSITKGVANHYRSIGLDVEHPVDLVRIPIGAFGHHLGYVWDFEAIEAELRRAGFERIDRCAIGTSEHPEFADLDDRKDEGGVQVAVEAIR